MTSRVFGKLLASFLAIIAIATITLDLTVTRAWENSLRAEITTALTSEVRLFADRVRVDHTTSPLQIISEESRATGARATLIRSDGTVVADSEADPLHMENHATRPEFLAALAGGIGTNTRQSKTVGVEFLYVAAPVPGGAVRLAYPLSSIAEKTAYIRRRILFSSALALLMALIVSAWIARSISQRLTRIATFADRIAHGDLGARIDEPAGDELATVSGALDHTARRLEASFGQVERSRAELERLLESMQDAVIAVDRNERVQWLNQALLAFAPQARVGSTLIDITRDPDLLRATRESLQSGQSTQARASNVAPGRSFGVIATPIPGEGIVLVLRDITDGERLEKTRRDFIANVSHELRTPLTSLTGYTEMLLDSNTDGPTRDYLEIIKKNAMRMQRLTEDLLTLARVESGETKLHPEPVTAEELLTDAEKTFASVAKANEMEIVLNRAQLAQFTVKADRDAVHQIFSNLIDNAIRYGKDGGRVEVGVVARERGAEFFVRDFGKGIASEHHARLFERFYRVDSARSRDLGGTGLGLAIVKHIVLNHGGTVRVESQLGRGATFFFSLPLAGNDATAVV